MFKINDDGYLEYVEDEKKEKVIEKHHYHYIPYPVYVNNYPWSPNISFPRYPQTQPMWTVTPGSYTWSSNTGGTNGITYSSKLS